MLTVNSDSLLLLDEVRQAIGLGPGQRVELDGFLTLIINAVSDQAEAIVGRKLAKRSYTNQLLDGDGSTELFLPQFPVDLTSSGVVFQLYVDSTRTFAASSLLTRWDGTGAIGSSHYRVEADTGIVRRFNDVFPVGCDVVKVNYTAGYDRGDQLDLVMALTEEAKEWWHTRGRDPAVTQGSLAGFSASLRQCCLSPKVKSVLFAHSQGIA